MREINIRPALNGWVCQIGCQTIVFNDKTHMLNEIGRYIDDPKAIEAEYWRHSPNKQLKPELVPAPDVNYGMAAEPRPKREALRPNRPVPFGVGSGSL